MSIADERKLEFVQQLFLESLVDGRSKRKRYRREALIEKFAFLFGDTEGFSEMMDKLVFEKLIVLDVSPSRLFTEYYLGNTAIDFLAKLGAAGPELATGESFPVLSADQKLLLTDHIRETMSKVESLDVSQERKAQIMSLLSAACVLAEAPEPPTSIIKQLLSDADRLIGIAGFLVGLAGLFVGLS